MVVPVGQKKPYNHNTNSQKLKSWHLCAMLIWWETGGGRKPRSRGGRKYTAAGRTEGRSKIPKLTRTGRYRGTHATLHNISQWQKHNEQRWKPLHKWWQGGETLCPPPQLSMRASSTGVPNIPFWLRTWTTSTNSGSKICSNLCCSRISQAIFLFYFVRFHSQRCRNMSKDIQL